MANRTTLAGQIPLIPETLDIYAEPTSSPDEQDVISALLSLQHVRRIMDVMGDSAKGGAGWKDDGFIEGVIGWYVGGARVEYIVRCVWARFAERVSLLR